MNLGRQNRDCRPSFGPAREAPHTSPLVWTATRAGPPTWGDLGRETAKAPMLERSFAISGKSELLAERCWPRLHTILANALLAYGQALGACRYLGKSRRRTQGVSPNAPRSAAAALTRRAAARHTPRRRSPCHSSAGRPHREGARCEAAPAPGRRLCRRRSRGQTGRSVGRILGRGLDRAGIRLDVGRDGLTAPWGCGSGLMSGSRSGRGGFSMGSSGVVVIQQSVPPRQTCHAAPASRTPRGQPTSVRSRTAVCTAS